MLKFGGKNSFLRAVILTTLALVLFCLKTIVFAAIVTEMVPSS
jgi:hypothetical protein